MGSAFLCSWFFFVLLSLCMMAVALFLAITKGVVRFRNDSQILLYSDESLPLIYSVAASFDTPGRNGVRSWFTCVADLLEASYRHFGETRHWLKNNTFVRFSPTAIQRMIEEYVDDDVPAVAASLPAILLKYGRKLSGMAVPAAACKSENCTEVFKFRNPVAFEVGEVRYAQTVSDMKHLLVSERRPLLLTMPSPVTEYWIPCYDPRVQNTKSCQNKQPCPAFIKGDTCGHVMVPSELPSSEYFQTKLPAGSVAGAAETLVVVGYTDDHVSLIGKPKIRVVKRSSGGFIVKRTGGNTIGFYEGSVSFTDNFGYCARDGDPRQWRAPLFKCMEKKGKAKNCSSVKKTERRPKRSSTILKCIDGTLCNTSKLYAMVQSPLNNSEHIVYEDESGYSYTKMYEFDNEDSAATMFEYSGVPYHMLGTAFRKSSKDDEEEAEEDTGELCNYWFLPYDVVDEMIMLSTTPLNRVHACSLDIKWERDSYRLDKHAELKSSSSTIRDRIATKHM